ncbi:NADPH-dependent F420 reductase [Frateuria aurantia]
MPLPVIPFLSRRRALAALLALATLPSFAQSAAVSAHPTIAIIGAGQVGSAWGSLWARAGYTVIFATRHPEQLGAVVAQAGPHASAASVGAAIARSQVVMLAVPYKAEPSIARQYGAQLKSRILIDADNAYPFRDGDLAVKARAAGVARYSQAMFAGSRFVRAFNTVDAVTVAGKGGGGTVQVLYSSADAAAGQVAAELIRAAGCVPVQGHEL